MSYPLDGISEVQSHQQRLCETFAHQLPTQVLTGHRGKGIRTVSLKVMSTNTLVASRQQGWSRET